ncbi:MAG TPA: phosphatidylserine decarboxylase family protein [Candidatus Brocadiia bacterium]|nr:phosphatidylserine decarboxylase family protein [Candidatus Brocadiales bacterium]
MRLPFAKYGLRELVIFGTLLLTGLFLCLFSLPQLSPIFILGIFFVGYFFRDPERVPPDGEEKLLAPADGTVVEISNVYEDNFLKCRARKIGIFMSIFDVHVNRAPCSGEVEFVEHKNGKFLDARLQACSDENERNLLGLAGINGRILVKQIAGRIARRIVCDCSIGQNLQRGERFGMIKFGSRLEVFIPETLNIELNILNGQKVTAGVTVLGVFK